MSELNERQVNCAFCQQPLPDDEMKIIHTYYGKTCSWVCSNALANIKELGRTNEKLEFKIEKITDYLNSQVQSQTDNPNIYIDFGEFEDKD